MLSGGRRRPSGPRGGTAEWGGGTSGLGAGAEPVLVRHSEEALWL